LPHTPSNPPAPAQQAGNVTLGTDLYAGYARVIATARKEGDDAEAAASQEILSAVARCAANP
jgi:hypothetical protein